MIHGPIEKRVPQVEEKIRLFKSELIQFNVSKINYEINLIINLIID